MSWQLVQTYSGSDKTNSATISTVWCDLIIGQLTVVGFTFDNTTATAPTITSISKPAGETANWTLLASADSNQAGGGGGVRSELWGIVPEAVSSAWSARTATLSASVTAKAWAMFRFAGGGATVQLRAGSTGISSASTIFTSVAALTGVTPATGELILVLKGAEGTTVPSSEFGWGSAYSNAQTTGQGGTSNVSMSLQGLVSPSAADQSLSTGISADQNITAAVLVAGPAAPPAYFTGSGTLEAHKTRYADLVLQTSASAMKFYYRFNRERDYYENTGNPYFEADASPRRRDQQVAPSNAGGSYTPGMSLAAGDWAGNLRESILPAFGQPGLIHGGDTGTDFSVSPRSYRNGTNDLIQLELMDYFMDICGGGRYYPGEGGILYLTCAAMINLDAYPTDGAGAGVSLGVLEHTGGRWYVDVNSAGKLRLYVWLHFGPVIGDYQNQTYDLTGNTALTLGRTHHVAWVFDGSYLRLFIDGVEDASMSVAWDYQPPGTNERQQVTISGSPTGGTFTLTFNGQTTGAIAYNAAALTVQTALEALSNINPNDIYVYGPYTQTGGRYWDLYFGAPPGQYGWTDVAQMTATSSLTGGTSPAVAVTTVTQGAPAPAVIHYTSGEIQWSSGSGGTDAGNRAWWEPGFNRAYLLQRFPKGRIDELALWSTGLDATTITGLANAAFVDPPAAGLRGGSRLSAVQPYQQEVLACTPEVYFRLNDASGSTVMTDYSGHGRHGTYVGSPLLAQTGLIAGGDTAMVPATAINATTVKGGTLPFASWMLGAAYTWEVIFHLNAVGNSTSQVLLQAGHPSYYEALAIDTSGRLVWHTANGSRYLTAENGTSLATGTHHAAVVMDGGFRTLYVDGLPWAWDEAGSVYAGDPTKPLTIGYRDSTVPSVFAGTLDEVAIYSAALDPAWIYNHAKAMTIAPSTPHADFAGAGVLTAVPVSNYAASVAVSGHGTLATTTQEVHFGGADLSSEGVLTVAPVAGFVGAGQVTSLGSVYLAVVPQMVNSVVVGGASALTTFGFRPLQQIIPETTAELEERERRGFWGKAL